MKKLKLIAGPCAVEDKMTCLKIAKHCKEIAEKYDLDFIFKGSYKKANRTKIGSFTTIGKTKALEILAEVRDIHGVPVITDVHETWECEEVAKYVDWLQIPAFLCRQTDLLIAAGKTGKGVNIKKGQFMSPESMGHAYAKVASTGNLKIMLTERGTTFGYNYLVVDMTSMPKMKTYCPEIIMDCTHSVQQPNQSTGITGGDPAMIETMALSAIAAGATGLFIEVHPDPAKSSSDAGSILQMDKLESILEKCVKIKRALNE